VQAAYHNKALLFAFALYDIDRHSKRSNPIFGIHFGIEYDVWYTPRASVLERVTAAVPFSRQLGNELGVLRPVHK